MTLLDGKQLSITIKEEIAAEVAKLRKAGGNIPHLAAILVGNDGASETYVRNKVNSCNKVGFHSSLKRFNEDITESELLRVIDRLNNDDDIDGFIVQLPLPNHIDEEKVIMAIKPEKDVDGFHPINVGRMALRMPTYVSATPYGIMQILDRYNIDTRGMHCVIIGRSNIVGRPMSILMAQNNVPGNCTVTICHSHTENVEEICRSADILIAAVGVPGFVKENMVKDGAIVIDVGITRVDDDTKKRGYRLAGDVDFESVAPKCDMITPVPGGVGPMTVTSLLLNTLKAAKKEVYT